MATLTKVPPLPSTPTTPTSPTPASPISSSSSSHAADPNAGRTLTFFGLLVLAFFWVNGGCYGNEAVFAAAPPLLSFVLITATPILYSLPISLIVLELTAALPFDGGPVFWVEYAFGQTIGGHNTYWLCVGYCIDSTIYPLLAAAYLANNLDADRLGYNNLVSLLGSGIILAVTLIKLAGTDVLIRFSTLLAVGSVIPTLLFICVGAKDLQPTQWGSMDFPGGSSNIKLSLIVAWMLWLHSGFIGLGALAGEVRDPQKSLTRVIIVLLPLVTIVNALPLAIALGVDDRLEVYEAGYFEKIAKMMKGGGEWLTWVMIVGALVANLGLYNSQSMVSERCIAQFVESRFPDLAERAAKPHAHKLHKFLFDDEKIGVGRFYILLVAGINLLLAWTPYEFLVEIGMLLLSPSAILILACFLYFRHRRQDMHRPYRVPGGMVGAYLAAAFPAAITLINMYFAIVDDTAVLGVPFIKVNAFVVIIFAGIVFHLLYNHRDYVASRLRRLGCCQHLSGDDETIPLLEDADAMLAAALPKTYRETPSSSPRKPAANGSSSQSRLPSTSNGSSSPQDAQARTSWPPGRAMEESTSV